MGRALATGPTQMPPADLVALRVHTRRGRDAPITPLQFAEIGSPDFWPGRLGLGRSAQSPPTLPRPRKKIPGPFAGLLDGCEGKGSTGSGSSRGRSRQMAVFRPVALGERCISRTRRADCLAREKASLSASAPSYDSTLVAGHMR